MPSLDPIPLPAPVWLVKVLHHLTLTLHFGFLGLLWGGLVLGLLWNLLGRLRRDPVAIDASGAVFSRLPIVTMFVINLGIPPLLFVQLLYGRIFYTSAILVGLAWLGVVFAVMAAYFLLYGASSAAARKGPGWPWGAAA